MPQFFPWASVAFGLALHIVHEDVDFGLSIQTHSFVAHTYIYWERKLVKLFILHKSCSEFPLYLQQLLEDLVNKLYRYFIQGDNTLFISDSISLKTLMGFLLYSQNYEDAAFAVMFIPDQDYCLTCRVISEWCIFRPTETHHLRNGCWSKPSCVSLFSI